MNLGDFSQQPCLVDPLNCNIFVSVWLKIQKMTHHETYVLGNKYSDAHSLYGFHVRIVGKKWILMWFLFSLLDPYWISEKNTLEQTDQV